MRQECLGSIADGDFGAVEPEVQRQETLSRLSREAAGRSCGGLRPLPGHLGLRDRIGAFLPVASPSLRWPGRHSGAEPTPAAATAPPQPSLAKPRPAHVAPASPPSDTPSSAAWPPSSADTIPATPAV